MVRVVSVSMGGVAFAVMVVVACEYVGVAREYGGVACFSMVGVACSCMRAWPVGMGVWPVSIVGVACLSMVGCMAWFGDGVEIRGMGRSWISCCV